MLASAKQVVALSDEHGFRDSLAIGNIMRGWCLSALGRAAEGIPLLLQGLTVCRTGGRNLMIPFFLTTLAEAYGMAAQPREGLDQLAEAAQLVETTHERWIEAEINRLRGTLLLSLNEHAAAETSYRRALEVAKRQSAKFWELRAQRLTSLGSGTTRVNAPRRAISSCPFTAGSPKILRHAGT